MKNFEKLIGSNSRKLKQRVFEGSEDNNLLNKKLIMLDSDLKSLMDS